MAFSDARSSSFPTTSNQVLPKAVRAYTRLAQEDKVAVVGGSLLSNTALAVSPVAEKTKVPIVSRAMDERATTPKFDPANPDRKIDANPYFFLTQPSAFQQAAIIASYAIYELKMNTLRDALHALERLRPSISRWASSIT